MPKTHKRTDQAAVSAIAHRMRLLRLATGLNQAEFARSIGVARTAWNNVEIEFSRIGVDAALKVCEKYRVTLDWIYRGDTSMMPTGLMKRIEEESVREEEAPPPAQCA